MKREWPDAPNAILLAVGLVVAMVCCSRTDADWTVTPRGSVALTAGSVTGIREFSGVTYMGHVPGPTVAGLHRFAAIQDSGNQIVLFDVGITSNGTLAGATAVSKRTISPGADYEGIVFTGAARNTVFVSEEGTPGVHEHNLTTGERLQSAALPAVFQNFVANKSLESLTRSVDGDEMWTANEEALVPDGAPATASSGTTVRLQKLADQSGTLSTGSQFAYTVDPIHTTTMPNRSGLVDMVMLPDDTLLALERSAAATLPAFRSRIYQVNFGGATDTSAAQFNTGLAGKTFTPVGKTQLWSGQVDGAVGTNLEGITLGPSLPNGNWLLLGVVDNAGEGATTIAAFELSLTGNATAGDFNRDGKVDQSDYVLWKNTYGSTITLAADSNGNQVVDAADYTIWRNNLSAAGNSAARPSDDQTSSIPEPTAAWQIAVACLIGYSARHKPASSKSRIEGNSRGRRL